MSEPKKIRKTSEQINAQFQRINDAVNARMNRINAPFFDSDEDEEEYSMLQKRLSRAADIADRMERRINRR